MHDFLIKNGNEPIIFDDNKVKVSKPYLIAAGVLILTLIISLAASLSLLLLISIIGLIVSFSLLKKALKKLNESPF